MAGERSSTSSQTVQQVGTKEQAKRGSGVVLTLTVILYHFTYLHTNVWNITPHFNIHFINKVQTVLNYELYSAYTVEHSYRNERQYSRLRQGQLPVTVIHALSLTSYSAFIIASQVV